MWKVKENKNMSQPRNRTHKTAILLSVAHPFHLKVVAIHNDVDTHTFTRIAGSKTRVCVAAFVFGGWPHTIWVCVKYLDPKPLARIDNFERIVCLRMAHWAARQVALKPLSRNVFKL